MEDLVLSCLESRVEENRNLYARFLVGPFLRGDALTVATALRRVLLSSVESIGITALSIQGITHEFSTIAGVRESVLELSLNFGAIVLSYDKTFFQKKSFFDKLQIGYLQVQGPKVIYANDLKLPLGVKLVDPTQYIATVSKEGSIVLKFIISKRNNFGLGLVHQNIGSESHLENKAKQLSIVGEVGKKNIVRAKKILPWPCLRALHPYRYLPQRCTRLTVPCVPQRGKVGALTNLRFGGKGYAKSASKSSYLLCVPNKSLICCPFGTKRGKKGERKGEEKGNKGAKRGMHLLCPKGARKRLQIKDLYALASFSTLSFENKPKLCNPNGAVLPLPPVLDLQDPNIHDLVRKRKEYAGVSFNHSHNHNQFKIWGRKNNINPPDLTSRNTDKIRRSPYKLKPCTKKEGGQSIRVKRSFAREALYSPCKSLAEICSFLKVAKQGGVQDKGKLLEKRNKSFYVREALSSHNLTKAKLYSVRESTCTCAKGTKRGRERALAFPFLPQKGKKGGRKGEQREKGKINKKKLKFLGDSSGNSNVFQSNICLRNVIPLDLTVTPILKVNFVIEIDDEVLYLRQKIRERIILEVWTNGSIHPRQAVHDSSLRLLDMFASFRSVYQVTS